MKRCIGVIWMVVALCATQPALAAPPRSANLSKREWEDTFKKERAARKNIEKAVRKAAERARREAEANRAADNLGRNNALSAAGAAQQAHYNQTVGRAYAEERAAATLERNRLAARPREYSRPVVRKEDADAFVPMDVSASDMLTALEGNTDALLFGADSEDDTPEGERLTGSASYPTSRPASSTGRTVVYGYGGGPDERSAGEKAEDWMHDNLPESILSNRYFQYAEDAIRKVARFDFGMTLQKFRNSVTDRALKSLRGSGKNALPEFAVRPSEAAETSAELHGKVMNLLTDRKTLSEISSAAVHLNDGNRKEYEADFRDVTNDLPNEAFRKASDMAGVPLPGRKDLTPERVTRKALRPIIRQQRNVLREKGEKWVEGEFLRYSRP